MKAASHNIPIGRRKLHTQQVPADILARLSTVNDEVTKATSDHKRIQTEENEGITITGRPHTLPKMIANSFNRQFNTSKLGKHSSSRMTHPVSNDVNWMCLEDAETFTNDQITSAIKSSRSSRHLAIDHLTTLYIDSLKSFHRPSIWKTSLVIPRPQPGKDSLQGTSYRHISLLCSAANVIGVLVLPSMNEFFSLAKDQHGFRHRHSTTSAFLQLTTRIETGFNQQIPSHRIVCVAIDLTAAFNTMSHDILISKIAGSSMPPAITRWLSCYLEVPSRELSAPTSLRDRSCHLHCSTIT